MRSKKKIIYLSTLILAMVLGSLIFFNHKKNPMQETKKTPSFRMQKISMTSISDDSQFFTKFLESMDAKEANIQNEFRKAAGNHTDDWKRFSARINLELKREFLALDEEISATYGQDSPARIKEIRTALEQYKANLLSVWREADSSLMKKDSQLKVVMKELAESHAAAKEKIMTFAGSPASGSIGQPSSGK